MVVLGSALLAASYQQLRRFMCIGQVLSALNVSRWGLIKRSSW